MTIDQRTSILQTIQDQNKILAIDFIYELLNQQITVNEIITNCKANPNLVLLATYRYSDDESIHKLAMDAVSKEIVDELGIANFKNFLMSSKHVFSCRSSWFKNLDHAQRDLVACLSKLESKVTVRFSFHG